MERLESINETEIEHLAPKKRKASDLKDEEVILDKVSKIGPSMLSATETFEFGKSMANGFSFGKSFANVVNKGHSGNTSTSFAKNLFNGITPGSFTELKKKDKPAKSQRVKI